MGWGMRMMIGELTCELRDGGAGGGGGGFVVKMMMMMMMTR